MEYVTVEGEDVPALGFGTARMDSHEQARDAVETALDVGYRHIDTAQSYDTEPAVGEAVAGSDVDREELFVTTKLNGDNRAHEDVIESTRQSLDDLQTEYVDLLLIHSPDQDVRFSETLDAMNELVDEGAVRHVGISNFSVEQTEEAMSGSDAPIFTNQVEYHPYRDQSDLLAFCIDEGIMLTAYSPLDVGDVAGDETLAEIGERHDKSASQVAIRWLLQQPMVSTVPKAADEGHIRENFDVFDFELDDDEMGDVFALHDGPGNDLIGRLPSFSR